jgi:hypothetical protein
MMMKTTEVMTSILKQKCKVYNSCTMQSTIGVSVVLRKKNVKKGKVRHTHSGIIAGKLNGHIRTHTPSGSLMLKVSIPLETFDTYIHPFVVFPIPQACSTTSTGLGVQNQNCTPVNGQHKKEFSNINAINSRLEAYDCNKKIRSKIYSN